MNLPDAVEAYGPAPPTRTGSPFLREAIIARLLAQHGGGTQHVLQTRAIDAQAWAAEAAQAAQAKRAEGSAGRIVFDVLSADHIDAYERASGRVAPPPDPGAGAALRAADLAATCEGLDLHVVGVYPYGIVAANITGTRWHRGTLCGIGTWERLLSWVRRDSAFHDFVLFVEEVAHELCSEVTARFLLVLEDRAEPAANAAWLARDARLRAALRSGFTREGIEPIVGAQKWQHWREGLRALHHPPSLIAAFRLLDVAATWRYPVDLPTLLEPGFVTALDFLANRKSVDDAMWEFVNGLQDDPELAPLLRPGPAIAPHFEYEFLSSLAAAL